MSVCNFHIIKLKLFKLFVYKFFYCVLESHKSSHWCRINFRNSVRHSGLRVGYWFSHLWQDMRRKSPVAVQHWVDSLPSPVIFYIVFI